MTISLNRRLLSKPQKGEKIPAHTLAYVRARNKNKAHSLVLDLFENSGLTKKELATILGKKPEQVTRWLAGPGNMTIETFSDLVFAAGDGQFLEIKGCREFNKGKSNHQPVEWTTVSSGYANKVRLTCTSRETPQSPSTSENEGKEIRYEIRSARKEPQKYSFERI
ncbi:hypothetical protein J3456_11935 [Sulfitobacter sp. NFXS29]|uniref:hypothetical protein n=1 Tax=Sulfitobacter sp. NFXS29 TaxID=2818438 RepID=UPI0032DF6673